MPRQASQQQDIDGAANVTLVTTAETVVAVLPGLTTGDPGAKVILEGQVQVTTGTGVTGLQLRVRRGATAAGAQVGGTAQTAGDARTQVSQGIQVDDNPGEVAGQQYCLTVQQVAATGNGTCVASNLTATYT